MKKLSSLNSLVYASLTSRNASAPVSSSDLGSFSFIADTEGSSIFAKDIEAAFGMLERVIKKVGFAVVLPYIKSDMLIHVQSHTLVSRTLRAGFDAAALVSHLAKRAPALRSPTWLHLIVRAPDQQEMITFLFENKSVPDPVSGELRSVMDDIAARYGCIPSVMNIWETLVATRDPELSAASLERLSDLLLARSVIPTPRSMMKLLSWRRLESPAFVKNVIHHPASPLPELSSGTVLHHSIASIILDSFTCSKKGNDGPSERCRELFSWCLRLRLLPAPFSTIVALLMEEDQSENPKLNQEVRRRFRLPIPSPLTEL
jgi:hypothetical protein